MKPPRSSLWVFLLLTLTLLAGCASLGQRESVRVSIAGIEPLPNEGLEARFAVKLRVQNPNDSAISYDGVFVELELEDKDFGSGVSDQQGSVPRFGETLITVPVTVPFTAMVRQVLGLAGNERFEGLSYRLRGRLGGAGFGGIGFDKKGVIELAPKGGAS